MDMGRNRVGGGDVVDDGDVLLLGDVCMGRRGSPLCCCDDGGTIVLFGRLFLAWPSLLKRAVIALGIMPKSDITWMSTYNCYAYCLCVSFTFMFRVTLVMSYFGAHRVCLAWWSLALYHHKTVRAYRNLFGTCALCSLHMLRLSHCILCHYAMLEPIIQTRQWLVYAYHQWIDPPCWMLQ